MKKLVLCFLFFSSSSFGGFFPNKFKANFEQSYISSISGKKKLSVGEIYYKYPSNIRLETKKPAKVIFVSNKEKTWYYTAPVIEGEPGEVIIKPSIDKNFSHFLDSLMSGLKTNSRYSVKAMTKTSYLLSFTKKMEKIVGVKKAIVNISRGKKFKNIKNIVLHYSDGKEVTISLFNLKTAPKFKNSFFTFSAPKNTNISN